MLSPPTSLAVWEQKPICLSVLFCALNAYFPLGTLGGLLEIYSFFSALPLCPKLSSIEQSKTVVLALNTHMCKLRSAHSVSVLCQKAHFTTLLDELFASFPSFGRHSLPADKIPSQNCISKSPVKKSSVVPSNVCLGSATNHKLHESFPPLYRLYDLL